MILDLLEWAALRLAVLVILSPIILMFVFFIAVVLNGITGWPPLK